MKGGKQLRDIEPDPVRRLEILIDGDSGLGVIGIRSRIGRIERISLTIAVAVILHLVSTGAVQTILDALKVLAVFAAGG